MIGRRMVVIGFGVLAALVACVLGSSAFGGRAGASTTSAASELEPYSITAVSDSDWWVLEGGLCCSRVNAVILQSTNGGRKFARIGAPPVKYDGLTEAGTIDNLNFSDLKDGFAWGGTLWSTHDDGGHWRGIRLGGPVEDLASAGGYVYAVISAQQGGQTSLWRSPVTSDRWTRLRPPGEPDGRVGVHGDDVVLQTFTRSSGRLRDHVVVSHDDGGHFVSYLSPVPGKNCNFDETFADTVWGACFASTGPSEIVRSTNGGKTFSAAGPLRAAGTGEVSAASSTTAIVLGSSATTHGSVSTLFRTTDGGLTYGPVDPPHLGWESLGFTDATHGLGLAHPTSNSALRLYASADAGRTFHAVPIP